MSDLMADCPEVEALAAELALGIVLGSERASALAHLGTCASCRRLVDSLTSVADPLLLLAPPAEPSIGFESRVLAATAAASAERPNVPPVLAPRRRRAPRRSTVLVTAAAALVVVIAAAGGLLVGRSLPDEEPGVRTAVAVSASGRATCRAFAYGDREAWVFVSLEAPPEWTADYIVEVTTAAGGRPAAVGKMKLEGGHASLGTTVDVPAANLKAIRVLDGAGALRYEAPFTAN